MSNISFTAHPLPMLMPAAIKSAQDLIRTDLTKAGLGEFASVRPNGRISDRFDQQTLAEQFDSLRGEALASMRADAQAGRQFVRVKYHHRLDRFESGSLDPDTVRLSSDQWASLMAFNTRITGVWGLSHPILASYLDGSTRWETRCEAIVVVDMDCRWHAVDIVRGYLSVGSSSHAPCWSWAGQLRTANTELAEIFRPMLWGGGIQAKWKWLVSYLCYPETYCGLPDVDRTRLLEALSQAVASPEVWWAVNLAAHTGLRAADLKELAWSHIGEDAIIIPTSKSRGTRSAFVPLYDDLQSVLAEIPKRSLSVLTNEKGRPWRDGVNGTSFRNARDSALPGRDLHFHDLRGTAATRFHAAGLSNREIAEIMAWEEGQVDRIIRRYVGRTAVTSAIIQKLKRAEG